MFVSDPVAIDLAVPHDILVTTTAFRGATSDIPLRMARKGVARVELVIDRRELFVHRLQFFLTRLEFFGGRF